MSLFVCDYTCVLLYSMHTLLHVGMQTILHVMYILYACSEIATVNLHILYCSLSYHNILS